MKILLICDNHSDSHHASGGAENYFFELKSRLKQTPGIEVYSVGFGDIAQTGDDFQTFKSAQSNTKKLLWRLIPNLPLYFQLKSLIEKIKPDVIHIHNTKQYSATVLRVIKKYRVVQTAHDHSLACPFAQNIHTDLQPCPTGLSSSCFWSHQIKLNKPAYLLLALSFLLTKKLTKRSVDAFITVSPGLANILKLHFQQPITYIPPFRTAGGLDITTPPQPYHFLFAGNIGRHKGIHILINEFALACQRNNQLFLNIAGSGPEEDAMKKLTKDLGIGKHVKFWGWQSNLERFYVDNISLVFPSIGLEGFPLVITEAMSHGRAVIGVNRGTTAWLVEDDNTGLLFDPLKKGDLAEKLLKLAGNAELALQLGKRGQQRISELIDNEVALGEIIATYKAFL